MSRDFSRFTNQYKLSQTLQFSLIPQGRTREFMDSFLIHDQSRSDAYPEVKKILDNAHKALIERTLGSISQRIHSLSDKEKKKFASILNGDDINWLQLDKAVENEANNGKENTDKIRLKYCELLSLVFTLDEAFESLVKNATPDKYFKTELKKMALSDDDTAHFLEKFKGFACYFKGFQENRRNIYSEEAQSTAAPHRAIYDNFPKMKRCIKIFNHIKDAYPEILTTATTELAELLNGQSIDSVFSIQEYSNYLSQKGIDKFNSILGGYTTKDGQKIKGINECINLYRQQHEDARKDRSFSTMPLLFKQILSDRSSLSFIPQMFQNDQELFNTLKEFIQQLDHVTTADGIDRPLIPSFRDCLDNISIDDGIFVSASSLTEISMRASGSWNAIPDAMENWAAVNISTKAFQKKWLKKSSYSLTELNALHLEKETDERRISCDILDYWKGEKALGCYDRYDAFLKDIISLISAPVNDIPLAERKDDVALIKDYLDSIMDILHLGKPLYCENILDRNEQFYSLFDVLYEQLQVVIPLYNRIRNYLTQKADTTKKVKLMFDSPTLADGWDQNKEQTNNAIILLKDGKYYLGIMNPAKKPVISKMVVRKAESEVEVYQKMVYKYLPGPNKMLPHVFFSPKGQNDYKPPKTLLENFEAKKHIKSSPNFNLAFLHELIDFFKASIAKHPDWSKFGFKFSPTVSYQGIDEFYREISNQGYRLSFEIIPKEKIDDLVNNEQLLLFQIYNKDFAPGATGTPDKFTIYWKMLFSPENLSNVILKLNGEAELFWRKQVIAKPFSHKLNEKMVNRTYVDGTDSTGRPIVKHMPEKVHAVIFDYVNGKNDDIHKKEYQDALALYDSGKVVVKDVTHPIIKDRRYTQESFSFHVPITINFTAPDKPSKFNDSIIAFLKNNPDVKIIGIDRGERNLIYFSLIDQQGNILKQGSLNAVNPRTEARIEQVNYHELLNQKEKERDEARKSWSSIGKIKDLKAGYLSQVIHQIARLMVENNAIVILEDLNVGFKRGRFAIEKQVYQNFEKALITKLNYLVFKEIQDYNTAGSVLNGYQLTDKFVSFEKMGKQTGALFYVPAAYTSKIDPTTGFANIFNTRKCTNVESRKVFLMTFDAINYNAVRKTFAFSFDYAKFQTSAKSFQNKWTVYTSQKRLVFNPLTRQDTAVNPTQMIVDALNKRGVSLSDEFDLKAYLQNTDAIKANAEFFKTIFIALEYTLQMRNSNSSSGEDYIESPVLNKSGEFFRSSEDNPALPIDADANGAYHIAMKGLFLLLNVFNQGKKDLKIEHQAWFEFMQKRNM